MKKTFKAISITFFSLISVYCLTAFTGIPVLSHVRILWIETAMTTSEHQWLATSFFPKFVIADVMSRQFISTDKISNTDLIAVQRTPDFSVGVGDGGCDDGTNYASLPFDTIVEEREPRVGERDQNGNLIIIDDIEQDILIVEVKGVTYTGRLLFVSDPSRVVVSTAHITDGRGQYITELCEKAGGIAAVNGNGSSGIIGSIIGWTVSSGEEWGSGSKSYYTSIGFDSSDKLIVGNIENFEDYNIRDLVQFMPALIVDGKQLVTESAGWGLHPRTAVGQTEDGTVILAVIDGRKIGYSIGITIGELADIFMSYGVVNAGMCDGGASSVMCYNNDKVGNPAAFWAKDTGKYLPNALVVLKK